MATAAALVVLPVASQAQSLQYPGFYVGAVGGLNWLLNSSNNASITATGVNASTPISQSYATGWALGGVVGWDFVGPRVELEGMYRENQGTLTVPALATTFPDKIYQVSAMANILYDFNA